METLPKLSIVTPTFNSIHTLRETIESVRTQQYPALEHLVIDGGSTDGTLELIKSYPHLKWVSEKDEGHYHAMNKGIQLASGEAVAILNADDCYCDGILKKIGVALAEQPDWDAVFGNQIFVDGDGRELFRREEAFWDPQLVRYGMSLALHQTLFVRKKTYERLGLLRHKDFKNCCDYEFLMRLARARCRVGHLPAFVVRYRFHQHGQSADKRIIANMNRERVQIQREYGVPGGLVGALLTQYARLKRQAEKLFVLGKCDLIPGFWHLRRHLRAKSDFSSNIGLDKS